MRFWKIILPLILLAACAPVSAGVTPSPTPIELTSGALWLRIISPADEAILVAPQVEVRGEAPAGAALSINDEILIVPADEEFAVTLPLEEGPNAIEIVASDIEGTEITLILVVTYQP